MSYRSRTLTASLLIGISALTGCALSNTSPVAASVIEEDDPRFDCLTDGNQVCGSVTADDDLLTEAWSTWDAQQGWTQMRVDPSREFRVEFDAYSRVSLEQVPGSVVLADGDGMRFRFVVTYL